MITGLAPAIQKVKFLVNDNSSTILTGMGVSGTIATAYLTGRASFKAAAILESDKKALEVVEEGPKNGNTFLELTTASKVKRVWRLYLPPFAVGVTTVASIIFANKVSSKKIAALTVASGISERALKEYKEKALEKLGVREDQKIRDQIAQDRVNNYPPSGREVLIAGSGEVLCYDMHSGRYFQSTVENIKRAENKINHEINHFMSASLSEFYDEIGLAPTSYADSVGWNGSSLVEVQFSTVMSPDDRPCLAMDFLNSPTPDYNRHYD